MKKLICIGASLSVGFLVLIIIAVSTAPQPQQPIVDCQHLQESFNSAMEVVEALPSGHQQRDIRLAEANDLLNAMKNC